MAAVNKIKKYNLENRVRELNKQGVSLRDIAVTVSNESRHQISKDSISTFLKSDVEETVKLIETKKSLQVAVVEAEISTIEDRLFFISKMKSVVESTTDERIKILATEAGTKALDSLDKRLGQVSPDSQTVINITQNNLNIKDKIQKYRDMGLFNAQ